MVGYVAACLTCGAALRSSSRTIEFCQDACRRAFNNRRAVRGAEFYDLYMAIRYDRSEAKRLKAWTKLTKLARSYREEDMRERNGRKSWKPLKAVLMRHTHLNSKVIG
ncbi:hypothetical protein AEAC466_17200 [Asticcacaulis sp. AC466]|nr:hypothetical protein AEAC466_17200 [Asticcacaulis sp. AC466]